MDEQPPQQTTDLAGASQTSVVARLTNILVAPGEVFDEVKSGPPVMANWVAPMTIMIAAWIVAVFVLFSQPALLQQIKETREKSFQKMVDSGQKTQKEVDEMEKQMENFFSPSVQKALGIVGALIWVPIVLFATATLMFLVGRFVLGGNVRYMQAVEATSLAMMVMALGTIVGTLLVAIIGTLGVSPGPSLLVRNFDPTNLRHLALASVNLFGIWQTALLSLALAKLSGKSFLVAAPWMFVPYAVFKMLPLLAILLMHAK